MGVEGGLVILEETEVTEAMWRPSSEEGWGEREGEIVVQLESERDSGDIEEVRVDLVWLATGGELDVTLVPVFAHLLEQARRTWGSVAEWDWWDGAYLSRAWLGGAW